MDGDTVGHDDTVEQRNLKSARTRIINELIHKIAQLLENTLALGLPLSQMGQVMKAAISAAFDTFKEEIESIENEEASTTYPTIPSPKFADEEARTQLQQHFENETQKKRKVIEAAIRRNRQEENRGRTCTPTN